jgi:hypothetical protein
MSFNQFHAAEPKEGRSAADVFASSSTVQSSGISSRFASSGKFTAKQLDDGDDGEAPPAAEEDEFDPDDKRPLYERLKAQKDAKEEEFQYNSAFKNQMDHWRLDEDEAAFEDERLAKFQKQEAERERLNEEAAQFYKLSRAQQDRTAGANGPAPQPRAAAELKRKPPPSKMAAPAFKVLKVQSKPAAGGTSTAAAASTASPAATVSAAASAKPAAASAKPAGLPGMGAYEDSDSDEDDEDDDDEKKD